MSKVVKTRARGPSYFTKNPKAPTPELNYNQYLGQKKYDPKFAQYYENDYKNSGYTLPYSSYIGPGNSLNLGHPKTDADIAAKQHDLRYAWHSYNYSRGKLTKPEFQKRIELADRQFLKSNSWLNLQGLPAILGIGSKHFAEKITGQLYPGNTQEHSQFQDPEIDENVEFTPLERNKEVQSMSDNKRPADSTTTSEEPAAKIAALTPEMAQLTGTGSAQASGGAASDGMEVYSIERPFSNFGSTESTYSKSHKFMTFGFADNFVAIGADTVGNVALTSYLAEIPWHIPALYLNQSEFDLLPEGTRVKDVSIKVIYRGSTIQFETAASSTGLATLNQINDVGAAVGLNRSGWGSNYSYSAFGTSGQPMIPTGIGAPKYGPVANTYRGMVRDYYGSSNATNAFRGDVPKHQTGRQTFLYNYWNMTSRGATGTLAVNFMFGGWPCLASMVNQMDGKTVVNQVIVQSNYSPKLAPLKKPLRTTSHALPFPSQNGTLITQVGGNLVASRTATVQIPNDVNPTASAQIRLTASESTNNLGNANLSPNTDPTFDIYSPIEKIQMGRSGYWGGQDAHIQPSVHVGVQPVPALSSAATLTEEAAFNKWTDTRAYWEVIATMTTTNRQPTAYPYAVTPNVPFGENVIWNPNAQRPAAIVDPTKDGATFCGLYTNSNAPVP